MLVFSRSIGERTGNLEVNQAQFRELEAFAQFGSDLDEKTKAQIERGLRTMEVVKQVYREANIFMPGKGKQDYMAFPTADADETEYMHDALMLLRGLEILGLKEKVLKRR